MTGIEGGDPGAAEPGAEAAAAPAAPAADRTGKILLLLLGVYAALCLLAAYAQLADDRALIDLFDLRRWFTR